MRKVFLSHRIETIAAAYRDDVLNNHNPYDNVKALLDGIDNTVKLPHQRKYHDYVKNIVDAFDNTNKRYGALLDLKPSSWNNIHAKIFSAVKPKWLSESVTIKGLGRKKFYEHVEDALGYKKLRGPIIRKYIALIGIRACYYCNAQYAITVEESATSDVYASYELDHCMAQSEYPYLSICFYNFHPSCPVCNKRKSNTFHVESMYVEKQGPYIDTFKFSLSRESIIRYMLSNDYESLDINFDCPNNPALKTAYDKAFHISSIYSQHKDAAEELLWKARCYRDADIDAIFQQYHKLFPKHSKDDFRRMLFGHHLLLSEVHKRPLNKMIRDIAVQLQVI